MKILTFAASNSSTSINKQLVTYVSGLFKDSVISMIDLNDFEMPIYSADREKEDGIPEKANKFKSLIRSSDKVIISFAEHNGSYSAAFKNIMDWTSRIEGVTWENKPFLLMAASPGARGGKSVLETAVRSFEHMGAQVAGHFSLPRFNQNFNNRKGVLDQTLAGQLKSEIEKFRNF